MSMPRLCTANRSFVSLAALVLGSGGCGSERSSNPLSPQIAGPLAGVTITTPSAIEPVNGKLIAATDQPITLSFAGASSTSVRPFTYEIDLAAESTFSSILTKLTDVNPQETSPVVVSLVETLDTEQVYFWRVRAVDGANSSAYSETVSFEVFSPVIVAAPIASEPSGYQLTATNSPTLVAHHAEISGPAEDIRYRFELATEPVFAAPSAVLTVAQAPGTVTSASPGGLPHDQTFHWRVRASAQARNGQIIGPWSETASFRTPPPPVTLGIPTPTSPINSVTVDSVRPTLTATNGSVSGPAGAIIYRFEVDEGTSFITPAAVMEVPRSNSSNTATTLTTTLQYGREYFWRVNASTGIITTAWSPWQSFRTPAEEAPAPGQRTPDPSPGGQLPLPNEAALINQLAVTHAAALANSNVHEGGSWDFMDAAVEALRQTDTRWGYNCKRGDCNDPSIDVVTYFYGTGDGLYSQDVYLIDIIRGIKSDNPGPAWTDITESTADHGTIGRWIYPRP